MNGWFSVEEAIVGKLYRVFTFHHASDLTFSVYDTRGQRINNLRWTYVDGSPGMVVHQTKDYTVFLVEQFIIHLGRDDAFYLVPLEITQ